MPCSSRRVAGIGAWALLSSLTLFAGACAKKGLPPGGPPDLVPPRVVSTVPDSGAARVPRDVHISFAFSEGMDPRSADALTLAPRAEIRQRRWSGRTLTVVLAESLRADQTYVVFMGGGGRDLHGNRLEEGGNLVFTTADSFPPGRIEGEIEARGFSAAGTYLWCYTGGRVPDSTGRDFDAVGLADRDGRFRIVGLSVPASYRLWAFADLNTNRSFEPQADLLVPSDTTWTLTLENPVVAGVKVSVLNPRAPARVRGAVLDSLAQTGTRWVVQAIAEEDSTRRVVTQLETATAFEVQVPSGRWRFRGFRDLDNTRSWQPDREASSPEVVLDLPPAADVQDVVLIISPGRGP